MYARALPSGEFFKIQLGLIPRSSISDNKIRPSQSFNHHLTWCFAIVADILAVWQCNRMQVSIFIFVQLNNLKNCLIAIWSPFLVHGQQVSNQQFLSQTSLESFCVSSPSFRILYLCHLSCSCLPSITHFGENKITSIFDQKRFSFNFREKKRGWIWCCKFLTFLHSFLVTIKSIWFSPKKTFSLQFSPKYRDVLCAANLTYFGDFDFRKRMGFTCIFKNNGEKVAKIG